MISSDMPELISMSDRVLVIRDGAIRCELTGRGHQRAGTSSNVR